MDSLDLSHKEIWLSPTLRALPSGTFLQNTKRESFITAHLQLQSVVHNRVVVVKSETTTSMGAKSDKHGGNVFDG